MLDIIVVLVLSQRELIFSRVLEVFKRLQGRVYANPRKRLGFSTHLLVHGSNLVLINVAVATHPGQYTWLQVSDATEDVHEQGIGRNIERYAQRKITGALIHRHVQRSHLAATQVALVHDVASRQRHLVKLARVPVQDNVAAVIDAVK